MPISIIELDSSTKEENITIILGRNIILKIIEDQGKQLLFNEKLVKEFVSVPDLCHDDTRTLVDKLIEEEAVLTSPSPFIRTFVSFSEDADQIARSLRDTTAHFRSPNFYISFEKEVTKTLKERLEKMTPKQLESMRSDLMSTFWGKVNRDFVEKENDKLLAIDNELKKKVGFSLLVPSNLLVCPKCKVVLSTEEFGTSKKCYSCRDEIKREDAERIYIHKVHEQIKKVWQENLWFEAYVAKLLRKLGYKTWTSVHVMGSSGILHEIDVLAISEKEGIILMGECKTGKVSRNDVFNFCTKMGDLNAHISILALIRELPEPETREFVKKNPAIIRLENMGKKEEAEILSNLRNRLSIKG